jgi:predicted RNase H-like nuclease (RuvC/YqgF family)
MKKLLIILLLTPLAWFTQSCSGEQKPETDPVKDSLTNVNGELSSTVEAKQAALDSFFRAFNDIQANLDEIKQKEKIITNSTANGDVANREEQIKADIAAIYDLMVKNKQRLASAKKSLKQSDMKVAEMQKTIDNLEASLATREQEITSLKAQLESLNLELSNLTMNYQESQQQSAAKTEQLNTAYYAYGTSKELIKKGVLTKEGGFIGIGKSKKLSETMDLTYFQKIDITQVKEISLGGDMKKAKLSSTHPNTSYKFEGNDGKVNKLVITDYEKFWSVSKYAVIVVE